MTYEPLSVSVWTVLDLFGIYLRMLMNSDMLPVNSDMSPVNSDLSPLSIRFSVQESILSCLAYLSVYQSVSA